MAVFGIRRARAADIGGICRVCRAGWRDIYTGLVPAAHLERSVAFYTADEVGREVPPDPPAWTGLFAAEDRGAVVGAAGGGMEAPGLGELFVLYVDPARRGQAAAPPCCTPSRPTSSPSARWSNGSPR